ncbi:MAG TPA: NADH-quinone oxidoreductase subunit N [Gemmataceae bacterium]|jgi:NADH-quinone oxidoreductase subunit N|nr:NADH-quinone oxidoreductase subunit N [Gemmataceae bacterium]
MFLTPKAMSDLQEIILRDVLVFFPEVILCGTIALLLLLRLFRTFDRSHLGGITLVMTLAALFVSWWQFLPKGHLLRPPQTLDLFLPPESYGGNQLEMFTGLIVYDNFTIFMRMFLLGFTALVVWLSLLTGIPDREDSADFYCLLLGATIGMLLMASSNHLLMVYIAVEMASLPSYGLAGFLKGRRQSSEASLKYVVYGGGASGIMLYGISLLAGKFGTAYLPDLAAGYVQHATTGFDAVLVLGTLFVLIGLAFKLAAVPFHFWCPDVFEGAATEVAAFLSVASKGAALALLGRLALILAGLSGDIKPDYAVWEQVARYLIPALAFFAALTATFGNLAAYAQTNLKRLLAYSTIAHAGYMMMGLATLSAAGAGAVLFYLIAYLFMNLGAFAVVAFIRNQTGSEDLASYRGLATRSPLMTVLLAIFLLSLLGMPPLAGFAAKWQVFSVVWKAGNSYSASAQPALGYIMYALVAIGGLNTAISAVYYLKVLKVMCLDRSIEDVEGQAPRPLPVPSASAVFGTMLAVMILVVFFAWEPLGRASDDGVNRFRATPTPSLVAERKQPR